MRALHDMHLCSAHASRASDRYRAYNHCTCPFYCSFFPSCIVYTCTSTRLIHTFKHHCHISPRVPLTVEIARSTHPHSLSCARSTSSTQAWRLDRSAAWCSRGQTHRTRRPFRRTRACLASSAMTGSPMNAMGPEAAAPCAPGKVTGGAQDTALRGLQEGWGARTSG